MIAAQLCKVSFGETITTTPTLGHHTRANGVFHRGSPSWRCASCAS